MLFEYKNTSTFLFILELRTEKHVDFKLWVHGERVHLLASGKSTRIWHQQKMTEKKSNKLNKWRLYNYICFLFLSRAIPYKYLSNEHKWMGKRNDGAAFYNEWIKLTSLSILDWMKNVYASNLVCFGKNNWYGCLSILLFDQLKVFLLLCIAFP